MAMKNRSSSLPALPSSPVVDEFQTVKKRIGGGFAYVTVPKL
jgi:hypothetical protein